MGDLFDKLRQDIQIVRLAEGDARLNSDHLRDFKSLILSSGEMYPGIGKWLSNKVVPGIKSAERAAFVGYLNDKPVVTAVAKRGHDAKICHLKIDESLQGSHIGEIFFSLLGLEIRQVAKSVHLTLPESLWGEKHGFFNSFGFESVKKHSLQYRASDHELRSESSFRDVWSAIVEKMPKLSNLYSMRGHSFANKLLLSVQPKFMERILSGKKRIEIRRKFSAKWQGSRVNLYSTSPVMALVGDAVIGEVHVGSSNAIWEMFNSQIGCSREEFDQYSCGCSELYAVAIEDVHPYLYPVPIVLIERLLGYDLRPPQSYLTLETNRPWAKAISLAAYLHGSVRMTSSLLISSEGDDGTDGPSCSRKENRLRPRICGSNWCQTIN